MKEATYSAGATFQQTGQGYPADTYSRSAVTEQPFWHRGDARAPTSTSFYGGPLTAAGISAAASYPLSRSLQKSSDPPFAVSKNTLRSEEGRTQLGPQHSTAAVAPVHRHAAGRQNSKSEGPPFALAANGSGRAVQSLPEPMSRETSPPYATHAQHGSADSPGKQAQARLFLRDGQEVSYGRYAHPSLPEVAIRQARDANGLVRDEQESIGMSAEEERAESAEHSSPRHSISSLRPYANDASLQVCALDPSHLLCALAVWIGVCSHLWLPFMGQALCWRGPALLFCLVHQLFRVLDVPALSCLKWKLHMLW